jgi:hypothetical protein
VEVPDEFAVPGPMSSVLVRDCAHVPRTKPLGHGGNICARLGV